MEPRFHSSYNRQKPTNSKKAYRVELRQQDCAWKKTASTTAYLHFLAVAIFVGAVEVHVHERVGGWWPKKRQYLPVVLAVTPGISCAVSKLLIEGEELLNITAQVMPGNQTCRTESVVSPLGERLAQNPSLPISLPLKSIPPLSQQHWSCLSYPTACLKIGSSHTAAEEVNNHVY